MMHLVKDSRVRKSFHSIWIHCYDAIKEQQTTPGRNMRPSVTCYQSTRKFPNFVHESFKRELVTQLDLSANTVYKF